MSCIGCGLGSTDNADGSRRDSQSSASNHIQRCVDVMTTVYRALEQREIYGNLFYLVSLLSPYLNVSEVWKHLPVL